MQKKNLIKTQQQLSNETQTTNVFALFLDIVHAAFFVPELFYPTKLVAIPVKRREIILETKKVLTRETHTSILDYFWSFLSTHFGVEIIQFQW